VEGKTGTWWGERGLCKPFVHFTQNNPERSVEAAGAPKREHCGPSPCSEKKRGVLKPTDVKE